MLQLRNRGLHRPFTKKREGTMRKLSIAAASAAGLSLMFTAAGAQAPKTPSWFWF
jgi:hypothetical protein